MGVLAFKLPFGGADATELLDIETDELAWLLSAGSVRPAPRHQGCSS